MLHSYVKLLNGSSNDYACCLAFKYRDGHGPSVRPRDQLCDRRPKMWGVPTDPQLWSFLLLLYIPPHWLHFPIHCWSNNVKAHQISIEKKKLGSHQLISCFSDMVMFTKSGIKTRVLLMITVWFTPHVPVIVVYSPYQSISHVKC